MVLKLEKKASMKHLSEGNLAAYRFWQVTIRVTKS